MEEMERNIDLEFKLVLGKPILVEKVGFLYPLNINEIVNMGIMTYYQLISLIVCDIEEIKKIDKNCSSTLESIIKISLETNENKIIILNFLSTLFREQVNLNDVGFLSLGNVEEKTLRIIDSDSYEEIKRILMHQNCIKKPEKKSKKLLKFEARLAKMRKKYGKENDTSLIEIVSAISAKHPSINLLNVGELTIYQLYDQLTRLNMIESYNFNFEAMCNGASSDDVKTKHWSSRIDNE